MTRLQSASLSLAIVSTVSLVLTPLLASASGLTATRLSLDASNASKVLRGFAHGSVSLHKLVGDRDSRSKRCMGYGSLTPDHVLSLSQNFKSLKLQVKSNNRDTTLIIKGPNQKIYCADDSSLGKDAGITLHNLKSGDYSVWVGTFEPKQKFPYSLSLE